MSKAVVLLTGAAGEMGSLLIPALRSASYDVVALDLSPLPGNLWPECVETVEASILDTPTLRDLFRRHRPSMVFHLAALLSSRAEQDPMAAHRINVQGTLELVNLCIEQAGGGSGRVRFMFPSSIAVYGLPDPETKEAAGAVKETDWNTPKGMYGCNKAYCELAGAYFGRRDPGVDFRAIRFPGLISATTVPTGGTTDYAPEMIHAAARGEPYACFVKASTRLPFMTMPDAVEAFVRLAEAEQASLSQPVYNIRSFSPTAAEIRDLVLESYPKAEISFSTDAARQAIVDSWPTDVDDHLARNDWGFRPRYGFRAAFEDYLQPALRERYGAREDHTAV